MQHRPPRQVDSGRLAATKRQPNEAQAQQCKGARLRHIAAAAACNTNVTKRAGVSDCADVTDVETGSETLGVDHGPSEKGNVRERSPPRRILDNVVAGACRQRESEHGRATVHEGIIDVFRLDVIGRCERCARYTVEPAHLISITATGICRGARITSSMVV